MTTILHPKAIELLEQCFLADPTDLGASDSSEVAYKGLTANPLSPEFKLIPLDKV